MFAQLNLRVASIRATLLPALILACITQFPSSTAFSILPTRPTTTSSSSVLRHPPLQYRVDEALSEPAVLAPESRWSLGDNLKLRQPQQTTPNRLEESFASAKAKGEAAFVSFVTAGYPTAQDTPSILMAMQEGGASVIELGMPFTDPQADGPTIQHTNQVAIENGTTEISQVFEMLQKARSMGLTVPVILMGYYNPVHQYGVKEFCQDSKQAGADGFIIVDLPPEEASTMYQASVKHGLSNIPLVAPNCSDERIGEIASMASTFLYCVSVSGVTGARDALPDDLEDFVQRVRAKTDLPLAVGFGISNPDMVHSVANIANGVVVGSAISKAIDQAGMDITTQERASLVKGVTQDLSLGCWQKRGAKNQATRLSKLPKIPSSSTSKNYFGKFGGQYIPELLTGPFQQLEAGYEALKNDPDFQQEMSSLVAELVEGPTPLQKAEGLTKLAGGATIWLKRDDLAGYNGSYQKINNAVGLVLMAKRFGMERVVAESVSGEHGISTATACAKLGLECTIYMGAADHDRETVSVHHMTSLGAKVVPVEGNVKEAVNEASRDLVSHIDTTFYAVGSATGPHPLPSIVRDFKSIHGKEIKQQMLESTGKLPDAVVSSVGGSQGAIGAFQPFVKEPSVALYGVEDEHCAPLTKGSPGVLHGALTYLVQDESGQIRSPANSRYYPGVEPEHAHWMDTKRASYRSVTDQQASQGFDMLHQKEGILPSVESSRAIHDAVILANVLGPGKDVVVTLSASDKQKSSIGSTIGMAEEKSATMSKASIGTNLVDLLLQLQNFAQRWGDMFLPLLAFSIINFTSSS